MTREECFNKACSYIKNTPYSNPNQFTRWFFKNNLSHAWCGAFIDYVIKKDLNCDWLDSCSNFGYVPTIVKWAKEKGYWNTDYTKAKKGDLMVFNWYPEKKDHYSHVGIVDCITNIGANTVEGNTSYGDYTKDCVAKRSRKKKNIVGVVLLPYKEEEMFNIGDYVKAKEDVKLYTSIEYKESKYTLKKGEVAWVRYTKGNNIALADKDTHEYFASAWTNELSKLEKYDPTIDYQKLYEEEVAKNKILQDKINKAIADLQ